MRAVRHGERAFRAADRLVVRREAARDGEACARGLEIPESCVIDGRLALPPHHLRARLGIGDRVDQVLVVDCSEATQIERVVRRNGWPAEQVAVRQREFDALMAASASQARRAASSTPCDFSGTTVSSATSAKPSKSMRYCRNSCCVCK